MIELPPMAVSQPAPAAEVPPGPQMKEAEPEAAPPPPPEPELAQPEPMPVPELPPEPKADAVLVAPEKPAPEPAKLAPKPKVEAKPKVEPKPKVERQRQEEKETPKAQPKHEPGPHAPRTSAPPRQSAGAPGQNAAQAARGSAGSSSMSASAWQGLVSARVNGNTRYPPTAQGATGASSVSFSIDRSGRLISASLSRSSGSAALDAEAVATVRRSSPFPPPPAELPGGRFNFTKTINFRH